MLEKEIKLSLLKKVDKVFNKGLAFYVDPAELRPRKESSIFFRKEKFNTTLNIGSKKIVNHFEDIKALLSGMAKLADLRITRQTPIYKITQDPKLIASEIRASYQPDFALDKKEFLKSLIGSLAKQNILVLEFVETWNKIDKANIDGFYLDPNVIVIKRNQNSFRREIFTLVHELAHYLLNEEEIETLSYEVNEHQNLNRIERWCNDFAFYFLLGKFINDFSKIENVDPRTDYESAVVQSISRRTHLSEIAIYTRLLYLGKISQTNYNKIKESSDKAYQEKLLQDRKQRELEKAQGGTQKGSAPKPINSPLLISTIQAAFHNGIISEYEVCKTLNVPPNKLDSVLS